MAPASTPAALSGALLLDKPPGITSARAVARVKRLLPRGPRGVKIGHTGTLDPLASGLMVLLLGRATRLSRYVTGLDKSYLTTASFGATSDTLDAEGDITPVDAPMPAEEDLRRATERFTGEVLQLPPMASAVKVGGRRLYELHRKGLDAEREPRPVTVHRFDPISHDAAEGTATFYVACSSGTYVRALVADLAASLGTAAYLTGLRRTRVGHLRLDRAFTLDALEDTPIQNLIIPPREVVSHLPAVGVGGAVARWVRNGRKLEDGELGGDASGEGEVRRVESGGELLAVYRREGSLWRPEVVLCGE